MATITERDVLLLKLLYAASVGDGPAVDKQQLESVESLLHTVVSLPETPWTAAELEVPAWFRERYRQKITAFGLPVTAEHEVRASLQKFVMHWALRLWTAHQ